MSCLFYSLHHHFLLLHIFHRIEGKRHAFQTSNVYVKNIVDAVDDNALRERSSEFGNITSAKVLLDEKEGAKGLGLYAIALLSRKLSKLTIICVVI